MSVLSCDRYACQNIMCDRLILNHSQRICNECWNELLECKKDWSDVMTKDEVRQRIQDFMESKKGSTGILRGDEIDREFDRLCG